jgi:hypothetical protein
MSSELVAQGQERQVLPTATNVAQVLASAPVQQADVYSMEEQSVAKKRGRKPCSNIAKATPVDAATAATTEPRYNTRARTNKI